MSGSTRGSVHGNKWKTISEEFFAGERTQHMCRNRFYRRGKEGSGTNKCGLCGELTKGHTCRMKAVGALNIPMSHRSANRALAAHQPQPLTWNETTLMPGPGSSNMHVNVHWNQGSFVPWQQASQQMR